MINIKRNDYGINILGRKKNVVSRLLRKKITQNLPKLVQDHYHVYHSFCLHFILLVFFFFQYTHFLAFKT